MLNRPGLNCPQKFRDALVVFENLLQQMLLYCQRKRSTFHGNQEAAPGTLFDALLGKGRCSRDWADWVVLHAASQLQWLARGSLFSRSAG